MISSNHLNTRIHPRWSLYKSNLMIDIKLKFKFNLIAFVFLGLMLIFVFRLNGWYPAFPHSLNDHLWEINQWSKMTSLFLVKIFLLIYACLFRFGVVLYNYFRWMSLSSWLTPSIVMYFLYKPHGPCVSHLSPQIKMYNKKT